MSALSDDTKAEGRKLVLSSDIDALMPWVREHAPVGLDHALYERTMRLCLLAGDVAKAIRMHNAVFDTYDADVERGRIAVQKFVGWSVVVAFVGGLLAFAAGIVALVRWSLP